MRVNPEQFKELFGSFPTSIAIVTAMDAGEPFGFTSNAICAVSAATPTLLISVGEDSRTLGAIMNTQSFAVNFLSASGRAASELFASKAIDKFAHVEWVPSVIAGGAPLFTEIALGYAECRVENTIRASDHWIFIARVEGAKAFQREPLVYQRGSYIGVSLEERIDA